MLKERPVAPTARADRAVTQRVPVPLLHVDAQLERRAQTTRRVFYFLTFLMTIQTILIRQRCGFLSLLEPKFPPIKG